MASTSPYQNNDYQAVSTYRPYQLPVNDIFKAISAQNEFWNQGARRIKNVYDSVLDLQLSKEENKSLRDKYIQDAQKQLSKLSAQNTADPDVQRQGMSLFNPVFKDEGIMSDDASTRHIAKVNSDALNYRNQENGKYYAQVNHQYALTGAEEFRNSKDRMAGKAYLAQRKEYEPFYDYTADYEKVIKNCPASTTKMDSINAAGYIESTSEKVRSHQQLTNCLEAGLNSKAFRQMQIEGVMNYRGNPENLRDDYAEMLSTGAENIKTRMQELSGQLEGINKNTTMKADEKKAYVDNLNGQIQTLEDQLINHTTSIDKLRKGDTSVMAGDEERIAGSLYQYRKLLKESYAASFRDYEHSYKADPIYMQRTGFLQNIQLKTIDYNHDVALKELDQNYTLQLTEILHRNEMAKQELIGQYKLLDGGTGSSGGNGLLVSDGNGGYKINTNILAVADHMTGETAQDNNGYGVINQRLTELNTQIKTNDDFMFNSFKERGDADPAFRDRLVKAFQLKSWEEFKNNGNRITKDGKIVPITQSNWFENYVQQNPKDADVEKWNTLNAQARVGATALNSELEQGETIVARNLGIHLNPGETPRQAVAREIYTNIQKLKPVVVNGVTITPEDIQANIEGTSTKFNAVASTTNSPTMYGGVSNNVTVMYVNGKPVESPALQELYSNVNKTNETLNSKLKSARAKVYNNSGFAKDSWFYNVDDKSAPVKVLKGIFKDEDGKEKPIQIEQLDFTGGYKVRIPGLTKDEWKDFSKKFPTKDEPKRDPNDPDLITITNGGYNALPAAMMSPVMKQTAYVLSVVSQGAQFKAAGPGEKVKGVNINFPMYDANGKQQNLKVDIFKDIDGTPTFKISDSKGVLREEKEPFAVMKYLQTIKQTN